MSLSLKRPSATGAVRRHPTSICYRADGAIIDYFRAADNAQWGSRPPARRSSLGLSSAGNSNTHSICVTEPLLGSGLVFGAAPWRRPGD